jgi:hypothetical protein
MSFLTRVMLEAEDASAIDLIQRNGGLQRVLREEGLRAAMQAAARQADSRRVPVYQEPSAHQGPMRQGPMRPEDVRQEPMRQEPAHQGSRSDLRVNSSGRLDRPAGRPNGPGEAGPVRTGSGVANPARDGSSTPRAAGEPVSNNSAANPDVTAIGQAREIKPAQSGKSRIVPEPDQIQSPPPGRRRSSLLEPPGS